MTHRATVTAQTSLPNPVSPRAVDDAQACAHPLSAYARDAWPLAAKWAADELAAHTPSALRQPRSLQALRAVLAEARASGVKVLAYGAGSGVCGAAIPNSAALVIDMRAFDQIIAFDPESMTVTVGAGLLGGTLEDWLNKQGYTCGHYPQSLYLSTVGGWLATRGIGTYSNKYGGIENLVYSAEVMLANGSTLTLGRAPRSAAGPRLLELFLGSEGTLGVITQVTLKIFTLPEKQVYAAYRYANLADGLASVRQMFSRHCAPALARLYDEAESRHLCHTSGVSGTDADAGCLLILGSAGHTALVDAERQATHDIALSHGAQALGPALGEHWHRNRYHAAWLDANQATHVIADSIEVAAPWPAIMPLYHEVTGSIASHISTQMAHLSHFYSTGTMIYFIFSIDDAEPASLRQRYLRVWELVTQAALRHGGTVTHHHGVGLARRAVLKQEIGTLGTEFLRGIKALLDPAQLLNPGKLVFD